MIFLSKIDEPDRNINGKWVWKNEANHYILNEKSNKLWQEFKDGKKQKQEFIFVQYVGSDVILTDPTIGIYVKLTQDKILYSFSGIDGFSRSPPIYMNGNWEIKPKITAKGTDINNIQQIFGFSVINLFLNP